jgi:hypothetical protein
MAVMQVASDLYSRNQEAKAFNQQTKADALNRSAKSKAEGTETILQNKRSVERQSETGRKALQLKGAAQASATSSNIGGASVAARMKDIDLQASEAISVARDDADAKRRINESSNRNAYQARLYSTENYKPESISGIFMRAGAGFVAGMAAQELSGSGEGGD